MTEPSLVIQIFEAVLTFVFLLMLGYYGVVLYWRVETIAEDTKSILTELRWCRCQLVSTQEAPK